MTDQPAPPGRPGIAAVGKPKRHRRPRRGKVQAPFLPPHGVARHRLSGHVAPPAAPKAQP